MAGLTELSRTAVQALQSPIEEAQSIQDKRQQSQQQMLAGATQMSGDMAVLSVGTPSYMQVVEALAGMRALMDASSAEKLSVLHSLAGGEKKEDDSGLSANRSDRESGASFFNPLSYQVQRPNQRFSNGGGQGGYAGGGRTGAGNIAAGASGIGRMLEAALAQSLNNNGMSAAQVKIREDAITLLLRTPESEANGFHELTGALVMLLAEQINGSANNAAAPGPELRELIAKLTSLQGAGTPISQPHMQALMDEIAVMLLMEDKQQTTPAAAAQNPMANTIMQLMQNMLGQRTGETPSSTQLRQLLNVLMKNLNNIGSDTGDTMKASLLMEQLLPDLLGMIDGEAGFIPGSVIRTSRGKVNTSKRRGARSLSKFSVKIDSNGLLNSDNIDTHAPAGVPLQYEKNGMVSLLDASDQLELAGGIKVAASMAKAKDGKEKLKVGTFSWNGGNDSVVMNAQGEAIVTNDAGKTWVPLPKAGISTYNPGNGGPTITYNPQIKSVTFSAGDGSRKVLGTMYADNDGVNIDMSSTNELTASGQIATMLSPES